MLVELGEDVLTLKYHEGRKSSAVGYIEKSIKKNGNGESIWKINHETRFRKSVLGEEHRNRNKIHKITGNEVYPSITKSNYCNGDI